MYEYITFSTWSHKATESINKYAKDGWRVLQTHVTLEHDPNGYPRHVWNVIMERKIQEET